MLSLAQALAALPDTADGIAAHLIALGRKGVPGDGCNCPVSNYLTGEGFHRVWVAASWTRAYAEPSSGRQVVETPAHITEFVDRFDAGEWPELVADDTAEVDRG